MESDSLRELVNGRIARHINSRKSLQVADAFGAAEKITRRRDEAWLRVFWAISSEANEFKSKRELAKEARVSTSKCDRVWRDLRTLHITIDSGEEVRLFRDDVEVRFRHSGKVNGARIDGGVCLHLANQPRMPYGHEVTISETVKASMDVHIANVRGSLERQSDDATLTEAQRSAAREDVANIGRGVSRDSDTLPLFEKKTA